MDLDEFTETIQSFRISPRPKQYIVVLSKSFVARLLGKVSFWGPGDGRRKSLTWDDSFREKLSFSFLSC